MITLPATAPPFWTDLLASLESGKLTREQFTAAGFRRVWHDRAESIRRHRSPAQPDMTDRIQAERYQAELVKRQHANTSALLECWEAAVFFEVRDPAFAREWRALAGQCFGPDAERLRSWDEAHDAGQCGRVDAHPWRCARCRWEGEPVGADADTVPF